MNDLALMLLNVIFVTPAPLFPLFIGLTQSRTLYNLDSSIHQYLTEGLAPATRRTYSAGTQSFTSFCSASGIRVLPATEAALLLFISHLASKNISHATIKVYCQEKNFPPENFYPRTKFFSDCVENFCPTLKIFVRLVRFWVLATMRLLRGHAGSLLMLSYCFIAI